MAKMTDEEKAFKKQCNGAALDNEELLEEAAKVPGPLGDAAKATIAAQQAFEAQLKRIRFEVG